MDRKVCVVGLGYVGLPLAVAFGKVMPVCGFDIKNKRIDELKRGIDTTREISGEDLAKSRTTFSSDPAIISTCDFIIVAVPTPVDHANLPDLSPLINASITVGRHMRRGAIVVYESTVHPGCTENDCVPVLTRESGLRYEIDFHVGYSPERINPGDKEHVVEKIKKIVSGCDAPTLEIIAETYGRVIRAGIHRAPSIKVAEAAKIIENTQRDINIALMNELKMIFDLAGIDWHDVIAAAATKWNFIKFTPGLVGGHCIGVDPYYLAHEAQRLGHHPEIILAGRRINDNMAKYEADRFVKHLTNRGLSLKGLKIIILGATFKPDIPDTRNSKVEQFIGELRSYGCELAVCEPHAPGDLFGCVNVALADIAGYGFVVKAVDHAVFAGTHSDYELFC